MILSMSEQMKLFLLTVIIGIATGFIYDIIKTIRKIIRHSNFVVQLEDFLFWLIISGGMFFIMLNKNSGQIRAFCIGGVFFGMLLYSLTLSKFVVASSVTVINFIIKIVMNTIKIILYPIKLIIKIMNVPYKFLKNFAATIYLPVRKYLHISNRYAKMKSKRTLNNLRIIFKKI